MIARSRRAALALAALCGALTVGESARALELPSAPAKRVNDYADVLDLPAEDRLERQLAGYAKGTTQQIAVAIFRSLDGGSLEDTSMQLAEKWKIGSKGKDDGVLVVVFYDDHKIRIEVGYGLEGKLTDARAGQIIRDQIAPAFRRNEVERGLHDGLAAIEASIVDHDVDGQSPRATLAGNDDAQFWTRIVLFFLITIFLIWLFSRRRRGPVWSSGGWSGGSSGWSSSDWGSGGGSGGGGGGSSFGGGGGSFGGGGASGSW